MTPAGGAVPLVNLFLGEVVFGGVGSGLYGMFFYIVIAVFVAGLMVGRTPEWLGKKLEAREIKIAAVGALFCPTVVLVLAAISISTPAGLASIFNSGVHGFTETLYAYDSQTNNNGSAFAGLRPHELQRRPRDDRDAHGAIRADVRGPRTRRRPREEEDRAGLRGHVPHRRADLRDPARSA